MNAMTNWWGGNPQWGGPPGCAPCPPPPCPPCPPIPPGCPPWFSPPTPPWYPGANAGVSFGLNFPQNPCRGHFLWDGQALWIFDGVSWQRVGPPAPNGGGGVPEAPIDGNLYGRQNAAWLKIVAPTPPPSIIGITFYTSSQTITIPMIATKGFAEMWGATGGSGGVSGTASAGTGAGGYLEKMMTGLVAGATLIYTQGTGGIAGAAGGGTGGNATATTLASGTQSIGTLTCNGSNGTAAGAGVGSVGGTATGGDVNITGQRGDAVPSGTGLNVLPCGGNNFFSIGADGIDNVGSAAGNPGNSGGLKITWYP